MQVYNEAYYFDIDCTSAQALATVFSCTASCLQELRVDYPVGVWIQYSNLTGEVVTVTGKEMYRMSQRYRMEPQDPRSAGGF